VHTADRRPISAEVFHLCTDWSTERRSNKTIVSSVQMSSALWFAFVTEIPEMGKQLILSLGA